MRFLHFLYFITLALFTGCLTDTDTTPLPNNHLTSDTTSYDFMWQIDTIGIRNSILYDVAVIDENNIWAVGQIETEETGIPDSNGLTIPPYNAIHWDGSVWKFERIPVVTFTGTISRGPIYAVFAFSSDDIWVFAKAGSYGHWNGHQWTSEFVPENIGSVVKMWGTSSNNIFFVGSNGNITHYNGNRFTRIYSGTTLDINDLWGSKNENTGAWEILCVASNQFTSDGRQILRIRDSYVEPVNSDSLPNSLSGIWFVAGKKYYVSGSGIFYKNSINDYWQEQQIDLLYYLTEIRGLYLNDIFFIGSFGIVGHYNGSTWKQYTNAEIPLFNGAYVSSFVTENLFIAVGYTDQYAIVLRGFR